jgi:hypothetical protein
MKLALTQRHALVHIPTNNLNLHIYRDKPFAERVDLDETWIDGTIEATELGDQTNVSLRDRLVGIRAADTARESTHCSDT